MHDGNDPYQVILLEVDDAVGKNQTEMAASGRIELTKGQWMSPDIAQQTLYLAKKSLTKAVDR